MPVNQFDDKKANLKTLISSIGAKEVDCRVRLTIHNVSNIPVLSGAYRVRWKFRDIDSKAAKQNHKKEQDRLTTLSVPSITASDVESTSSRNSIATITGLSDSSGLLQSSQPSESGVSVAPAAVNISADERGYTHYRHLRARDHTVTFDHAIDVVARLRIVKGELIGEPLKLVVERRTDESEALGTVKFEPRLGHKTVDLAEFVNEGKVRRKFLLDRSKTNAMVLISLDITTVKGGIDFKKPPLRQDHLLIGRKEPVRLIREKNLALINTAIGDTLKPGLNRASVIGDSFKPGLSRTSSTTSSKSSSIRSYASKGMVPSRSETEAVIEALFNPTIFTRPTSVITSPLPTPSLNNKPEEALTPRPKSPRRKGSSKNYASSGGSSSTPSSPLSTQPIAEHAELVTGTHQKKHSLTDHPKTPLTIVLDMNADKDRTIRPKFFKDGSGNSDNYEVVDFADGSRGLKKKSTLNLKGPHRTATGDSLTSTRTDFSTTSSYPSRENSASSYEPASSSSLNDADGYPAAQTAVTSPEDGGYTVPSIAITSETPTTAHAPTFHQSKTRWFKPFKRNTGDGSRPSTPNPSDSRRSFDVELTGH